MHAGPRPRTAGAAHDQVHDVIQTAFPLQATTLPYAARHEMIGNKARADVTTRAWMAAIQGMPGPASNSLPKGVSRNRNATCSTRGLPTRPIRAVETLFAQTSVSAPAAASVGSGRWSDDPDLFVAATPAFAVQRAGRHRQLDVISRATESDLYRPVCLLSQWSLLQR